MPVKVKRQGNGSLRYAFRARLGRAARAKAEGAEVARSVAVQLCPVSENDAPGHVHMRDTIKLLYGKYGGVRLVVEKDYAGFVNFGTVNQDANPFFTLAVEAGREHMRRVMRGRG